jgi:hypothetical protein
MRLGNPSDGPSRPFQNIAQQIRGRSSYGYAKVVISNIHARNQEAFLQPARQSLVSGIFHSVQCRVNGSHPNHFWDVEFAYTYGFRTHFQGVIFGADIGIYLDLGLKRWLLPSIRKQIRQDVVTSADTPPLTENIYIEDYDQ